MNADVQQQFEKLGVKVRRTETADRRVAVWPENEKSVMAFLECQTQFRVVATMSRLIWLGMDYTAVKAVLDADGHGPEIFADIRTMEAAALPVLNKDD